MKKVTLLDTEKMYAIVNELNARGTNAGCVYNTFYGLVWSICGKAFHWNTQVTQQEVENKSVDEIVSEIREGIYAAMDKLGLEVGCGPV